MPGGRDAAVNGSVADPVDPVDPGDEPGARTIGALALKRWAARGPGRGDAGDDIGDGPPTHGPFDEDDVGNEPAALDRVDFGAVRVPVPRGGEVSVEPEDGRLQAVHVMLPAGRLSVSALAAPRTERLWPDLAAEIDESLREGGATVRSFTGEWGRELHARTGDASSLFVGVDGPRWMLYGVATGPTSAAAELVAALRTMLRGTVVVRGRSPYPVRTVLPLTVPGLLPPPGVPERVPVPRMPAERTLAPLRPAPLVDAPTTITAVVATPADGEDTVPHGIPRSLPGALGHEIAGHNEHRAEPTADSGHDPAGEPEPDPSSDSRTTETGVSRTASRGLFRRRPERPSARPPQRRVADLIAQAERDRSAPERGHTTPRPGRPAAEADDRGQAPGSSTPSAAPPARPMSIPPPVPAPDRSANGHGTNGSRTNGFVPRELAHDHPTTNGTGPYDRFEANGTGYAASAGSTGRDARAEGAYLNGSYAAEPALDEPRVNGSPGVHGPFDDEPPVGRPDLPNEWTREHRGAVYPSGFATESAPGPDFGPDFGGGAAGGPAGRIEATVWASMALGAARPSSTVAPDGSDDWTLPLPVVRPAPEPEPTRPAFREESPRGRRARREAEERAAEQWSPEPWSPEPWSAERWATDRSSSDRHREPDRYREPDQGSPGAHSADRPRHAGGHHEPEPVPGDRSTRASRRNAGSHARHAEESDDARRRADRARHRRPDH